MFYVIWDVLSVDFLSCYEKNQIYNEEKKI